MKALVTLSLILTVILSSVINAQEIEGIATYKTQRKVEMQLDSTHMDDAMRDRVMAMMKKQLEREYTLEFTKDESTYKEVETLDDPGTSIGGNGMRFEVQVVGGGNSDLLYKNVKENRFANQNEMFGKQFLIKDDLSKRDWVMHKETKNIGEYTCFKATYTYERDAMRTRTISNEKEEIQQPEKPEKETIEVVAWYTPQIPVQNGPGAYGGLPGLILEVNDGELTVLCNKVVLNPKNGLDIKEPKGGKMVSQEEYDKIMDKKMEEMEERFQSDGRRKGNGSEIEIRVRG